MRTALSIAWTVLAAVAVWAALVFPARLEDLTPSAFLRIPVELLVIPVVALLLRPRARRTTSWVLGALLGLVVILKLFDMGFRAVLDRSFDPVIDLAYLGPGVGVLRESVGTVWVTVVIVAVVLAACAVLVLLPLFVGRLAGVAAGHRRLAALTLAVLALGWVVSHLAGLEVPDGEPVASATAVDVAKEDLGQLRTDLTDRSRFAALAAQDRFAQTPSDRLLTGLKGKDVVVVFVESYGRVAVQDSSFSGQVDQVLDRSTRTLQRDGFSARSGFLTSPTFGAGSWLAHSTLQSGLPVDSQQRYNQLLSLHRLTLTRAFHRAGWRTVFDLPAVEGAWPDGKAFYGFDTLYGAHNVGYAGPDFSWAAQPDQYVLSAFDRLELARPHRPVMAEIDLVSSHHPWTPLPRLVPWNQVGDGSVFEGMPQQGPSPEQVFRDPKRVQAAYGQSVVYSLTALYSWVHTHPDPNLVMVVLGDHQPHSYVTGPDPGHDVPVSIVAHDPAVLRRISGWGWQDGLRPRPDAPVTAMNTFRDRFLTAFGSG